MEQKLHDINDLLGGMNRKTIASKLRNAETDATVRSGYNQAAEDLNNLVAPEYKFLDDVKDLRAREALESWFPGQGGGFGSEQGFGNIIRNAVAGAGLPTAATVSHNPWLLLGVPAVSPKLMAQGTIKNLGRLANLGEKIQNSPLAQRLLTPLAVKGTAPILYGGVQYNDY